VAHGRRHSRLPAPKQTPPDHSWAAGDSNPEPKYQKSTEDDCLPWPWTTFFSTLMDASDAMQV